MYGKYAKQKCVTVSRIWFIRSRILTLSHLAPSRCTPALDNDSAFRHRMTEREGAVGTVR